MLKREKELLDYQLDTEEKIMAALEKIYGQALRSINEKIRLYQAEEMTASRAHHINFQKQLKQQVEAVLEKLHGDEYTTIQQYLNDTYTDSYVGVMYDLAGQGVPVVAPVDRRAAVKAILTDSKISVDLYTSLGVDIQPLKKAIRTEITRGIATGMHYADIARNIATVTGAPKSRAKSIVRTEGHRIQEKSRQDARMKAKAKGADIVKQWDAVVDGGTRPNHRKLDGQVREVDEPFEVNGIKVMNPGKFGDPAEDCECRCIAHTRARARMNQQELDRMKKNAEFWGLDKTEDFEDFKGKYLKASETENDKNQYNQNTIKGQYKQTDALNEYDYFEKDQEEFRLSAIKELSNATEERAIEYLDALCGQRDNYIRARNNGVEYQEAWFYGADSKIRAGTTEHYKQQAQTIHDYIVHAPKFEGEIYRGLSLPDDQIARFKAGGQFEENGLLSSWTSSFEVADMFANGRSEELGTTPVIIKMKNPSYGTPVSHLSIFGQEEQEVLASNIEKSTFTIGSVKTENGITIVELLE